MCVRFIIFVFLICQRKPFNNRVYYSGSSILVDDDLVMLWLCRLDMYDNTDTSQVVYSSDCKVACII